MMQSRNAIGPPKLLYWALGCLLLQHTLLSDHISVHQLMLTR